MQTLIFQALLIILSQIIINNKHKGFIYDSFL